MASNNNCHQDDDGDVNFDGALSSSSSQQQQGPCLASPLVAQSAADGASTSTSSLLGRLPPETDDESDSYIANALKSMSLRERDDWYHELHGVADVIEETPELLENSIQALKEELIVQTSKTFVGSLNCRPFELAEEKNYDYVHSEFLYKAFLRAERFDALGAAKRMIRYYEYKYKSFGEEYLCHDITQQLLSEQDLKVYRYGYIQVLPCRDAMGRAILANFPCMTLEHRIGSTARMGRLFMYENWSLIQDEDTQRKGATIVVIVNPGRKEEFSSSSMVDMELIPQSAQALLCFPLRYAVIHHCFSDFQWKVAMKLQMQLVSRDIRARNKIHYGATMDCATELMGFGIPPDCLPINMNGEVKTKQHVEFIKMRKKQEEMIAQGKLIPLSAKTNNKGDAEDAMRDDDHDPSKTVIVVPSLADILLGRGKPIHSHPGNVRLHQLVDDAVPRYENCRKLEKTELTVELVNTVKQQGGRFLKQDQAGVWLVTDDDASRNKVSHLFRARRGAVLVELARQQGRQQSQHGGGRGDMALQSSMFPPAGKRTKVENV